MPLYYKTFATKLKYTLGDGRLFVLGTEGYNIEVRKYCDVAGRAGGGSLTTL